MSGFDDLIGAWRTEGDVLGDDDEVVAKVVGTDAYERMGAFVVHRIDVDMGSEHVQALEMIGPITPGAREVPTQSYDAGGETEASTATLEDDGSLTFGTTGARAHLVLAGDTMAASWERDTDDGPRPWLNLRFTRQS